MRNKLSFLLILFAMLSTAAYGQDVPKSVFVMPPHNATGSESFQWLSFGLQDALTVNLWQTGAISVPSLGEALQRTAKTSIGLSNASPEELAFIASKLGVDQIWIGRYEKSSDGRIGYELQVVDTKTSKIIRTKTVTTTLGGLLKAQSEMSISLLEETGIMTPEDKAAIMLMPMTNSVRAFQKNAEGYDLQMQYQLMDRRERRQMNSIWITTLEEAVKEDPGYAEAWVNLGWAQYSTSMSNKALISFQKAIELKPLLIDAHMGAGYAKRDNGDYAGALADFRQAYVVNPHLGWVQKDMDSVLLRAGGGPDDLKDIIRLVKTSAPPQRLLAIGLLGNYKDTEAVAVLTELAQNPDNEIVNAALKSLIKADLNAAIQEVKHKITNNTKTWEYVVMLYDIEPNETTTILIERLKDRKCEYREAGVRFISSKGIKGTETLLSDLTKESEPLADEALWALSKIGGPDANKVFIRVLGDERSEMRGIATSIICDRGDKAAIPALWEVAKHDELEKLNIKAMVTLACLEDETAINALLKIISGKDAKTRNLATQYIRQKSSKFMNTKLQFILPAAKIK